MKKTQNLIDFSIVAIVNNMDVYDAFCQSLYTQENVEYELIPIFNLKGEYESARKAYNSKATNCKGKYIIFTHPDIRFEKTDVLLSVKDFLSKIPSFGVIGVAGADADEKNRNKRIIYSNILHGKEKKAAGIRIGDLRKVQTVDECFFVVKRDFFLSNKGFREADGWHLYAVELCLQYILQGKSNYVVPADMWHMSDGKSLDANYVYQLEQIIKIYEKYFPIIYTTVKIWKTRGFFSKAYRYYFSIKQRIKKMILR